MHCVAIDDEPIAVSIIEAFCQRQDDIELHSFTDPAKGIEYISSHQPDLVFLDIQMNSSDGLKIAKILPEETLVIFASAYSNYAINGFDLNAIDFLHKPFSYARFEKALNKAREILDSRKLKSRLSPSPDSPKITVKVEYKNVDIYLEDIHYIESMDNYSKIYKRDLKPILSQISLKALLSLLPESDFVRVHRSFIVPLKEIQSYTKTQIILKESKKEIPIGRQFIQSYIKISHK